MPSPPKIIHFVWAGGTRMMPEDSMRNIKNWAAANPTFNVKIWIDKASDSTIIEKFKFNYGIPSENISLADITEEKIISPKDHFSELVRYELNRLRPNFGASSDLLRYKILDQEGGAYFDCSDVFPGSVSLEKTGVFTDKENKEDNSIFLSYPNAQNLGVCGNDALISSSGNPVIKKILAEAIRRYEISLNPHAGGLEGSEIPHNASWWCYAYGDQGFEKNTMFRTGPTVVRCILEEMSGIEIKEKGEYSSAGKSNLELLDKQYLMPLDWVTPAPTNAANWLEISEIKKESELKEEKKIEITADEEDRLINAAIYNILYEASHMQTMRLDYVVRDLTKLLKNPVTESGLPSEVEQRMMRKLVAKLENSKEVIIFSKVKTAQLVSRYPTANAFYREFTPKAELDKKMAIIQFDLLSGKYSTNKNKPSQAMMMMYNYFQHPTNRNFNRFAKILDAYRDQVSEGQSYQEIFEMISANTYIPASQKAFLKIAYVEYCYKKLKSELSKREKKYPNSSKIFLFLMKRESKSEIYKKIDQLFSHASLSITADLTINPEDKTILINRLGDINKWHRIEMDNSNAHQRLGSSLHSDEQKLRNSTPKRK